MQPIQRQQFKDELLQHSEGLASRKTLAIVAYRQPMAGSLRPIQTHSSYAQVPEAWQHADIPADCLLGAMYVGAEGSIHPARTDLDKRTCMPAGSWSWSGASRAQRKLHSVRGRSVHEP